MTTNFHTAISYKTPITAENFESPLSALDSALSGTVPLTSVDINGGTVDGTPIGASVASTGRFTNLTVTGATTGVTLGISNVTDLQATLDSKSPVSHTHDINDVTNLQTSLDSKSGLSHTHIIGDVTGLQSTLDSKSPTSHSHAISDVSNLQTTLDGKATSSHSHAISDVTNLQTSLDGKASSIHTHGASDVTSGVLDNARVNWASPAPIGATTASTLRGTTLSLTSTNNVLSSLIPSADDTYDLGSASNRWQDVFGEVGRFDRLLPPTYTNNGTGATYQNYTPTNFTPTADTTANFRVDYKLLTINHAVNSTVGTISVNRHDTSHSGTGTTSQIRSHYLVDFVSNGTITGHYGVAISLQHSAGVIGSRRGIHIGSASSGGTITNNDGIYIDNLGSSTTTTSTAIRILAQSGSTTNRALVIDGGEVIINESGTTSNFRVESDTNANMLYVDGTNNRVYVGASTGSQTFTVNGTLGSLTTYSTTVGGTNRALYVDNTGLIGYVVSRAGAKNSILTLSDEEGLFDKLNALRPVSFYYNNDMSGQRRYGLIAEEVDAVNPHWVSYDEVYETNEETGGQTPTGELIPATVNYNELIAVQIAGYQHLFQLIESLEARIAVLEGA